MLPTFQSQKCPMRTRIATLSTLLARLSLIAGALAMSMLSSAQTKAYINIFRGNQPGFGILDLETGAFSFKGDTPNLLQGIGERKGTIYAVDNQDNLVTINPGTAAVTLIGPTHINSPVPPPSGSPFGSVDVFTSDTAGDLFALDWARNLYSIDPSTGSATLVGPTGLPTILPGCCYVTGMAADACNLYFIIGEVFDPAGQIVLIPSSVYAINPRTAGSTLLSHPPLAPQTIGVIDGVFYLFKQDIPGFTTSTIARFNPFTGDILSSVSADPTAGLLGSAVPLGRRDGVPSARGTCASN